MSCARCASDSEAAGSVDLLFGTRASKSEAFGGVLYQTTTEVANKSMSFAICSKCFRQRLTAGSISIGLLLASLLLFVWLIATQNSPGIWLLLCLAGLVSGILVMVMWRRRFLAPVLRTLTSEVRAQKILDITIRRIP